MTSPREHLARLEAYARDTRDHVDDQRTRAEALRREADDLDARIPELEARALEATEKLERYRRWYGDRKETA